MSIKKEKKKKTIQRKSLTSFMLSKKHHGHGHSLPVPQFPPLQNEDTGRRQLQRFFPAFLRDSAAKPNCSSSRIFFLRAPRIPSVLPHKRGPPPPCDFLRPKDLGCRSGNDSPPGESAERRAQVGLSLASGPLWMSLPTAAGTHGGWEGQVQAQLWATVLATSRPKSTGGWPSCGKAPLGNVACSLQINAKGSQYLEARLSSVRKSLFPPMPVAAVWGRCMEKAEGPRHVVLCKSSPPNAPNHREERSVHVRHPTAPASLRRS